MCRVSQAIAPMIIWTKEFETGSLKIDYQHRMLINHINRLEELLNTKNPNKHECEFLKLVVTFLEDYADKHFKLEEACMFRYRCPAHAANQQAHERFRDFFRQYRRRFEAEGFKLGLIQTLHETCSSWVQDHILKIDTQLRDSI
jgi:hemerythrin